MDIKVTMRPHVANLQTEIGGKTVTVQQHMKQCFVHANGEMIAIYCGEQGEPNKYLSFISAIPEPVQKHIAAEVAKLTGGVGSFNAPPPDDHDVPGDDE